MSGIGCGGKGKKAKKSTYDKRTRKGKTSSGSKYKVE